MCKYIFTFQILFIVSAILDISSQSNDEDYISKETKEIYEINKVVDSASKEDREVQRKKTIVNKDLSSEIKNLSMKVSEKVQVNEDKKSSYKCSENKESSSEERHCKASLVNYPFSVSIQKKGAHYASGALIDRQHVITVAEEFYNVRETIKLFRVRLGSVDCKRGGIVLPIKLVEIHPQFVQGQPSYDVALLRLSQPVEVTESIKPISLSNIQQGVISAKFMTTYWPRLIINGELLPKTAKERLKHHSMRVSTQKLIPWKTCATLMKAREAVLDHTSLCLKPITTHHSICSPDVGAPVVAEDGLWGITSGWTSEYCTKYPSPTIFTRTNMKSVKSWVKSITDAVAYKTATKG